MKPTDPTAIRPRLKMLAASEPAPEFCAPPVGDAPLELEDLLEPVAEAPFEVLAALPPAVPDVDEEEVLPGGTTAATLATEDHLAWEFVEVSPSL